MLVLTILFLATVLFFKRPQGTVDATYALPDWQLPIDTSRVLKIAIQKPGGVIIFEREHGTWKCERGERLPADSLVITRLLTGIADFRLLGLVSSSPRKHDLYEVGEAGTPISVTTEKGTGVSLVVGKMSSLPHRSYVRSTTSDTVFLASGLTPELVSSEAIGWFRGTTFRLDSGMIRSIHIETQHTEFTAHRRGGAWFSGQNQIPTETIRPVVALLQELRAGEASGVEVERKEKPTLSLEVQERRKESFEFYQVASPERSYIMKTSISPGTFLVGTTTASPLLQLANVVASRAYGVSQSEVESPAHPVSDGSQSELTVQHSIPLRKDFSTRERAASAQENKIETTSKGSAEDEGVLSVHKVKPGETLESIAQLYNITKNKLKEWNLLTGDVVPVGTELYVFVRK